jgi:acetyl esterase
VAAIAAAKCGLPQPAAALLFYPVIDLRGTTWSSGETSGAALTGRTMEWFRTVYLGGSGDVTDWRASPLIAASLAEFPATFMTSAGHDPLCDEAFCFAGRLRAAGIRVVHRHLPGQIHGYLTLGRIIGEAARSIEAAAQFLTDELPEPKNARLP